MRNENQHHVVVCTTDARRLAVLDFETKPGDRWNEHGAVVFGKWMIDNPGHRLLDARFENGRMITWVELLH